MAPHGSAAQHSAMDCVAEGKPTRPPRAAPRGAHRAAAHRTATRRTRAGAAVAGCPAALGAFRAWPNRLGGGGASKEKRQRARTGREAHYSITRNGC
eukprot:gene22259-biopygen8736